MRKFLAGLLIVIVLLAAGLFIFRDLIFDAILTPAVKPVIYLYPEETTDITVQVEPQGRFTTVYPAYNDGWRVTAQPDGTLTDAAGREYYCLYWEGEFDTVFDLSAGFCVSGGDTAAFLEDALAKLGLSEREANEMIIYWLPLMQENPWNLITFQTDAYTAAAPMTVSPAPDTVIRFFMVWKALDAPVDVTPQTLSAPERSGFTVVEWGGAEVK